MNKILLTFTLLMGVFFQLNAATVTWDGDAGTDDWFDVTNWDTDALPTATDDVDLNGQSVTLTANTTVLRVFIDGSATFTVGAGVTLTVNNNLLAADGNGALEVQGSAFLVNNGTISIANTAGTNNGHGYYNKGTTTNNGMITIDGVNVHGLYVVAGTFTNGATGSITVTNVGIDDTAGDNIYTDDANSATLFGALVNDGTITITMAIGDDGIYVNDGSSFVNNSIININGSASANNDIPLHVADESSVFTNSATGVISITGGAEFAVQVDGDNDAAATAARIENAGSITVTDGLDDAVRLRRVGIFNNNAGGSFTINNAGKDAIQVDANSTITNAGTITIDGTSGNGGSEEAMELNGAGSTFNNLTGGLYRVINCADDGIEVNNGSVVNNDGDMRFEAYVGEAIETFSGFTFNNTTNATFAPGASPGEMELKGDIDLGTSTTTFEITGTTPITEYDLIDNFAATGGTAVLTITNAKAMLDWGSFVPAVDDEFKIVDGSGPVNGEFATISSSNLSIVYDVDYTVAGKVIIKVTQILPVELNSFEGKTQNKTNALTWQTQSEENNDYFEVQHSTNGREFTTLDIVAGNGTTTDVQNYDYTHKSVTSSDNYYRLKQVDFDGDFEYSDIIYLQNDTRDTPVAIYPNPARELVTYEGASATLTFFDIQGRKVMQQTTTERTAINISTLGSGVYTIEILTNTGERTFEKLIKE